MFIFFLNKMIFSINIMTDDGAADERNEDEPDTIEAEEIASLIPQVSL